MFGIKRKTPDLKEVKEKAYQQGLIDAGYSEALGEYSLNSVDFRKDFAEQIKKYLPNIITHTMTEVDDYRKELRITLFVITSIKENDSGYKQYGETMQFCFGYNEILSGNVTPKIIATHIVRKLNRDIVYAKEEARKNHPLVKEKYSSYSCSFCGSALESSYGYDGEVLKCPHCGRVYFKEQFY